jgi:hypothetical protein
MFSNKYIYLLLFFTVNINIFSQVPVKGWGDHLSYANGTMVTEGNDNIYCATEGGGIFYYKKSDNTIHKLSKINGLNDIGVTSIKYIKPHSSLMIGYFNGNIDIVENNKTINISDIKNQITIGNKIINSFFYLNDLVYASTGFGIVVLDIINKEIKETYYIGPQGNYLEVNDIAFNPNSEFLYAATVNGIYKADINKPNLIDFNNWNKLNFIPQPNANYNKSTFFNNKIYINHTKKDTFDQILMISNNNYEIFDSRDFEDVRSLENNYNYLVVGSKEIAVVYNSNGNEILLDENWPDVNYAIVDEKSSLWMAKKYNGMEKYNGSKKLYIAPNGPRTSRVVDMSSENGVTWAAAGSKNDPWGRKGANVYYNNDWEKIHHWQDPPLEELYNISKVLINPTDASHVWGGSYGYGVGEFKNNKLQIIYDETNSPLRPISGFGHGYIRTNGIASDRANNLWVCVSQTTDPLYVRKTNGDWIDIDFDSQLFSIDQRTKDILALEDGSIWIVMEKKGLFIYNHGNTLDNTNDDKERFIEVVNQDDKQFSGVLSITKDLEGNVWVGTTEGPVVYYNPEDAFSENEFKGHQILIPRNDGTNLADYLLGTASITDIAIDGDNRKWFGTSNSGVYLISEDGTKTIHHFNFDNSPIISNAITSLAIDEISGEVFIGTDKGIVSYRSDATEGKEDFSETYVFPNPVRPDYTGFITVTNLVKDADVKITDVSGNLVFEDQAKGGQVTWNGNNLSGDRVQTGVYLIFCTNEDGSLTHVDKLLFIH